MREAGLVCAAAAIVGLTGCSPSGREWHGFVLGRKPDVPVRSDPMGLGAHVVLLANGPGFPWQSGKARLDRAGDVMAVTLMTDCCAPTPDLDPAAPTEDEQAVFATKERRARDRYEESKPPPPVANVDWYQQPRTISPYDMDRYAEAELREATRQLGTPASLMKVARTSQMSAASSDLPDRMVMHARWERDGTVVALFDADHESVCLSIVAPDVPHPPLDTACRGVRMDCSTYWYPDDRPVLDTPLTGFTPPAAPVKEEPPACRPD